MGPVGREAIRRNQEAVEAARSRQPPPVQPKHAKEEVGPRKAEQAQGAEKLRETIERRELKPGPDMPVLGNYNGPMRTPQPPRYGDPNFGDQAVGKMRQEREARQAQQQSQQQKQER